MRKTLSILFAIGMFPSLSGAQRTPINLVEPGASLKSVLESVSKQSGASLGCSAALANEIVIVRLKDAPLEEVKAKLASTMVGEWQSDSSGRLTLVRPVALSRKAANETVAVREKALKEEIDRELEKLAKAKPTDDRALSEMLLEVAAMFRSNPESNAWERLEDIKKRLPQAGAVYRVLKACSLKPLAALRPGQRIVYSSKPTAAQLPISPSVLGEIRQIAESQALWSKNTRAMLPKDDSDFIQYVFPWTASGEIERVLLICRRGNFDGIRIEMRGADPSGRYVLRSDATMDEFHFQEFRDLMRPGQPSEDERTLELKGVAKDFALEFRKRMEGGTERQPLPDVLKNVVAAPEKYEPIAYTFGSLAVAMAESLGLNMVALTSDHMLFIGVMSASEKLTANRMLRVLQQSPFQLSVEQTERWLTFRPLDLASIDGNRMPRATAAPIARRIAEGQDISMEDWASLAAKADCEAEAPILLMLLVALVDDRMNEGLQQWQQLRFYGQLDVNQRRTLASGASIPFGMLAPEQKATLSRFIFNGPELGNEEPREVPSGEDDEPPASEGLSTEVTEVIPSGIPSAAPIKLKSQNEAGYFADVKYGSGYSSSMFMTTSSVAWHLFVSELPNEGDPTWRMNIVTVQAARSTNHQFAIKLTNTLSQVWTLRDQRRVLGSKKARVDELPASDKAEIEKLITEFRRSRVPPSDPPRP